MGVLIHKEEIDKALKAHPNKGKRLIEPFKSFALEKNLPFKILEDCEVLDNEAEVHKEEGDLWLCLEGEAKFVYGGQMVDPWPHKGKDVTVNPVTASSNGASEKEWKAKKIAGGVETVLKPGDWLWIPAGEPHQHSCESTARLIIIKIPLAVS